MIGFQQIETRGQVAGRVSIAPDRLLGVNVSGANRKGSQGQALTDALFDNVFANL